MYVCEFMDHMRSKTEQKRNKEKFRQDDKRHVGQFCSINNIQPDNAADHLTLNSNRAQ